MMKDTLKYGRTKAACFTACFTMASAFSLPPLLFVTLQNTYGISYTLLGTLVLATFFIQLIIDLVFAFFARFFNIGIVVKLVPFFTSAGLALFAILPNIFPNHAYLGLLAGTLIFSVASGLSEVLLSPIVASVPSDNSKKDMSTLHSLYAFGVFFVVIASTVFFSLFGRENWMYLTLFFAVLPIFAGVLFIFSPIPQTESAQNEQGRRKGSNKVGLALCTACIFFGGCSEVTMSNWVSGYMENSLNIDKALGDILGMAGFAILLGVGRFCYAKFGKNIFRVLLLGMLGASVCYLTVGLCHNTYIAIFACALTGLFTSMLWPGTLIMMEENMSGLGVAAYALMAAGGDLGASVAPQLMGVITDKVAASEFANAMVVGTNISAEQIGLRSGMLFSAIFPVLGSLAVLCTMRYFKNKKTEK